MDIREMKFNDNYFDIAIDKSTIDALLCGEQSFVNVAKMTKEVQRVLKEGGIYMIISYGKPENRLFHLEREHLNFDINIYTIKKDYTIEDENLKYEKVHYVYICQKKANNISETQRELIFNKVLVELEQDEKMEEEYCTYNDELELENEKDDYFNDDELDDSEELDEHASKNIYAHK